MRWLFSIAAALLILGCGGDSDEGTTASEPTTASESTTTEPTPSTLAYLDPGEPWDLVFFSDSSGWGVAELWGERIEEDLGVDVRVHDQSAGSMRAAILRDRLTTEGMLVRDLVRDAEIVVINGNPLGSGSTDDAGACLGGSTPPVNYTPEDFAPYGDVLHSIYATVFELRDGQPTIVRALDLYNPLVSKWREHGIEAECIAAWQEFTTTIHGAAAAFGVPTAAVAEHFMGTDFTEDPTEKGYIGPDDKHTTDEGKEAIVDVLHALGLEPVAR